MASAVDRTSGFRGCSLNAPLTPKKLNNSDCKIQELKENQPPQNKDSGSSSSLTQKNIRSLTRYVEGKDKPDYSDDFEGPIRWARRVQISPESPFAKADLVVFYNNYRGPNFLNSIIFSEYLEISHWVDRIRAGRTPVQIQGNAEFQEQVIEALVTILTRRMGRDLIKEILQLTFNKIIISPLDDPNSTTSYFENDSAAQLYKIFIKTDGDLIMVQGDLFGELVVIRNARAMTFFHEFTHLKRLLTGEGFSGGVRKIEMTPLKSEHNTNLEEEETIDSENLFRSELGLPIRHFHITFSPKEFDTVNEESISQFMSACSLGFTDVVGDMLKLDIPLNTFYSWDEETKATPLMIAASFERWNIVALLIEHGADPTIRDETGWNLMHWGIETGNPNVVRYIHKLAPDCLKQADASGKPSLMMAIGGFGKKCVPMVETLIELGANIHYVDSNGQNLLHWIAAEVEEEKGKELFQQLIALGLDPQSENWMGIRPVHIALNKGSLNLVYQLTVEAKDLFCLDAQRRSLMHHAVISGQLPAVAHLWVAEQLAAKTGKIPFSFGTHQDNNGLYPIDYSLDIQKREVGCPLIYYMLNHNFTVLPNRFPYIIRYFQSSTSPYREPVLAEIDRRKFGIVSRPGQFQMLRNMR